MCLNHRPRAASPSVAGHAPRMRKDLLSHCATAVCRSPTMACLHPRIPRRGEDLTVASSACPISSHPVRLLARGHLVLRVPRAQPISREAVRRALRPLNPIDRHRQRNPEMDPTGGPPTATAAPRRSRRDVACCQWRAHEPDPGGCPVQPDAMNSMRQSDSARPPYVAAVRSLSPGLRSLGRPGAVHPIEARPHAGSPRNRIRATTQMASADGQRLRRPPIHERPDCPTRSSTSAADPKIPERVGPSVRTDGRRRKLASANRLRSDFVVVESAFGGS